MLISFIKKIFLEPTESFLIQAFRAFFIGGLSFVADASVLWIISLTGLHYLICAVFGFIVGVAVNYLLSSLFIFTKGSSIGRLGEIIVYIALSLIGLGFTALLMWLLTDFLNVYFMLSKCIAALLVFAWNFIARKFILYRKES